MYYIELRTPSDGEVSLIYSHVDCCPIKLVDTIISGYTNLVGRKIYFSSYEEIDAIYTQEAIQKVIKRFESDEFILIGAL